MTFSVEIQDAHRWEEEGALVELYLDAEAVDDIMQQLQKLRKSGDHVHLMTPSWGGAFLTEEPQVKGNTIVHHLRITLVASGEASRPDS